MIADQKSTQPRRRQGGLHAFRSILLFVLAPLALAPSPASAALLEVDLNGTPQVNGLANLDTRTGLIWLDLPFLQNFNYDAAEGYSGVRHATQGEVTAFLNFYNPGNCFVDLPGFGDVSVSLPFVCGEIEGTLDVTYAAFDDDADGLTDALDPDCATADDDSEYHLSSGDILAVSYELPAALYRVDPASGARTTLMSIELDTPWGVATGPAGQVFVSDAGSEAILELDPSDGSVRVVSSRGALDFPRGLMDESDGKILVADVETRKRCFASIR